MPVHDVFWFEGLKLDITRGSLESAGRGIELRPKSFDVLRYLIENADRLVSKGEIMQAVWRNVAVTDESLTRCISDIRLALGDDSQRIIKTIPRRGYRFAASVSKGEVHGDSNAHQSVNTDSGVALPLPDRPSIAVLPFVNMSGDPLQDYFSDGLSEDLTTSLSKFASLFVIARNSAFQYKNRNVDAKRIGRDLGVRYVLEGSVRRDADHVRITAQLIDAGTGAHLWAEFYDRELGSVFAVQDEVTRRIVVTLVAHINKSEIDRALRKQPETMAAYDHCLRGNALMKNLQRDGRGETIAKARACYERSLVADPDCAPAFLGLANTYLAAWIEPTEYPAIAQEYRQPTTLDRAQSVAQQAIERDSDLAEAHAMLGYILHQQHRRAESLKQYQRAFALNPNLADGRYGVVLCLEGRTTEGIEFLERVMRLDPFHPASYGSYLAVGYFLCGRNPEALDLLRNSIRRLPGYRPARIWHATVAAHLDLLDEARASISEALKVEPGLRVENWLKYIGLSDPNHADRVRAALRSAGLAE
jgi:TolB-like protein/tetratricopeptide (TPR) repeat protein